jgi:hypothetical protein
VVVPALVTLRVKSSVSSCSSFFSMRSVTWSITSCAEAPGHCAEITMVLIVKLGSSSRPSFKYEYMPNTLSMIMK